MIEQKNNAPSLRPAESDPAIIELNTSDSGRAVLGITHAGRTAIESVGVILEPPEDCDEPKPGYVLIEGSIETLNEEAGAVWELMDLAHKNSDADTQEKIEQFEEEYAAACTVAVAKGKEIPPLADALSTDDNLPEDYKTLWLAYDALETKIEDAEKELDNHASEKAADVKQKALALEKNVNYDEVVTRVFDDKRIVGNHPALRTVTAIISARKLIENGNPLTYTQLKVIEHKIDESAAQCTEEGLLRSSDVPVDEVDTLPSIKQAAGIGERITDLLNIRLKYKYPDQTVIANGQAVLDTIWQAKQLSDQGPADYETFIAQEKMIYNDGLDKAVGWRLARLIEKLPADEFAADIGSEAYAKLVEQARDINVVDVVRNLSISGSFKDLPFSFNEKGLRLFLALSVPPIAIASVKRLQFRPPTKEEDEKDNTLGFRRWSDELGGSEIVISDVKVHEHYESTLKLLGNISKAKQFAESETKDFMLYGILHEFAHEFHHTLPLAALKRWEDQRVTDPTNITPYVKKCFDEKLVNPYVEDFAESSAFFGLKPYVLNNISSTRFKAMQELMSDFMPIYDKILQNEGMNNDKQRFKEMGMSDEDVRKIYLEHEGKP